MSIFNDSDEYDFNPSSSSKLAALFGNTKVSEDINNSLTYTAPKQPQVAPKKDTDAKPQTSVQLAKIVSLWKLENKDYRALGKHGLAVIGSPELDLYEIIAYKEKNNILLRIKVNAKCKFYNKKDYFSSFYDNEYQNWLAKFENSNDQNSFCQTIEKHGAEIINNVEDSRQADKQPDTSKEELKIKNEIPSDDSPSKELDINSDSSGSQKRANILSRMARMGQQILPNTLVKNTSTDISDSELDDSRIREDRKVPPRKFKRTVHAEKSSPKEEKLPQTTPHIVTETQIVPSQNNYSNYAMPVPQNAVAPMYYGPPMQYDGFNNFLLAQNAELKMSLSQISAKLDSVVSQNNNAQASNGDSTFKAKVKVLELKTANLESELRKYDKKYSNLEKMYKELQDKYNNEKLSHENNETEVLNLTEEINKLRIDLKESEEKTTAKEVLTSQLEDCQQTIEQYEKTIQSQTKRLKELEQFYKENKHIKDQATIIDSLKANISTLETKIRDLEEGCVKTEAEKQKIKEKNDQIVIVFSEKIKEHMNNMYQSVLENFEENKSYSLSHINSSIAKNLKGTTFNIINDLKGVCKVEDIE